MFIRLRRGLCVAALVCLTAAAACAQGGPAPAGGARGAGATTRLALYDTDYLADKGVSVSGPQARADLQTFGGGLGVQLFDSAKLRGAVFIADAALDISDAFAAAFREKHARGTPLKVPALRVPDATVAFIDTDRFGAPEGGVRRLVEAFRSLEAEFKPRRDEVAALRAQAEAATGERKSKLEAEAGRKQREGQAALDKRVKKLTDPVYADIGAALMQFCQRRGISLLFDLRAVKRTDKLPPFDLPLPADAPDVTADFVAAFNSGEVGGKN